MRSINVLILAAIGTSLAGCASTKFATVDAFCQVLPQSDRAVRGKTRNDQRWISATQEAEISGCNFPRPKAVATSYYVLPRKAPPAAPHVVSAPIPAPRPFAAHPSPAPKSRPSLSERINEQLRLLNEKVDRLKP